MAEETDLKTQCVKGISSPAGPGLPGTCPVSVPNISNLRKPIPGKVGQSASLSAMALLPIPI